MSELCIVVGATGAVGRPVTERLVARGLRVLAVARSADALAALAAEVPGVRTLVADIADDAAEQAIRDAVDEPVRMVVLAAGLPIAGSVETVAPGDLAVGANIKLGGLLRLVRAVDARLEPGSRIVMFAGTLGLEPKPSSAGPGAINAAVLNLMRQLGDVYGPRGITTHTLVPGPTDSPRLRAIVEQAAQERGRHLRRAVGVVRRPHLVGPPAHRRPARVGRHPPPRPRGRRDARRRPPPRRRRVARHRLTYSLGGFEARAERPVTNRNHRTPSRDGSRDRR